MLCFDYKKNTIRTIFSESYDKNKSNTFNDIKNNCMIAIHSKKCSYKT